jgi:hypothetical protein
MKVIAVAATLTLAVIPAGAVQAATPPGVIVTTNGVAGMEQSVGVLSVGQTSGSVNLTAVQGQDTEQLTVRINRVGVGQVRWTPPTSGTWTISAEGGSLKPITTTTTAMPTTTQVAVPTNPTRYRYTPIIATITPGDQWAGSSARDITGKVIFREVVRGVIGEAEVRIDSDGTPMARLEWAPPGQATYAVTGEFVPAADSRSGSPVFAPSTSDLAYFTTGLDPKRVELLMPQTIRVGDPAYVIVHVDDDRQGRVSLKVDGRRMSLDKTVERDLVKFPWVPANPGVADVQVVFHEVGVEASSSQTDQNGIREYIERLTLSNVVEQTVEVLDRLPANPISVSPVVKGVVGTPWQDDSVVDYAAGTRVRLVSSTGNGAPVVFATTGSCVIGGNTLYLPPAGGGCTVQFSAPGGAGFDNDDARVLVSASVQLPSGTAAPQSSAGG